MENGGINFKRRSSSFLSILKCLEGNRWGRLSFWTVLFVRHVASMVGPPLSYGFHISFPSGVFFLLVVFGPKIYRFLREESEWSVYLGQVPSFTSFSHFSSMWRKGYENFVPFTGQNTRFRPQTPTALRIKEV